MTILALTVTTKLALIAAGALFVLVLALIALVVLLTADVPKGSK